MLMSQLLPYATAFGLALLHSLWMGGLLYVIVRTLLPLLPSPQARHHLAYGALLFLAGTFGYTMMVSYEATVPVCEKLLASNALAGWPGLTGGTDQSWREWFSDQIPVLAPWLSGVYLLGLLPAAMLLYRDQGRVNELRANGLSALPGSWASQLGSTLAAHPATRRVRCYLSDRAGEVMTLGCWQPVIVLPVALVNQLTPEMARTLLLHEIAHLRHYDHWLNYPQQLIRTFFFFHPAAHALSRLIDREREHRCDDWVAARCADRRTYATALVTVARSTHTPPLKLIMSATKTPFTNRIQRLFIGETHRSEGHFLFSALLVTILGFGHFSYTNLGADAGAADCLEAQSKARQAAIDRLWLQLTTGETPDYLADVAILTATPPLSVTEATYAPCPDHPLVENHPYIAAPQPQASRNERALERYDDALAKYQPSKLRTSGRALLFYPENLLPKRPCLKTSEPILFTVDPTAVTALPLRWDTIPPVSTSESSWLRSDPTTREEKIVVTIDGMPIPHKALNTLDPALIASINIIKDKATLRARNLEAYDGLVMVITKTGNGPAKTPPRDDLELPINSENILYIVDGKELPAGRLRKISPANIESMNILKGKSMIAKGYSGYDGVILITTK